MGVSSSSHCSIEAKSIFTMPCRAAAEWAGSDELKAKMPEVLLPLLGIVREYCVASFVLFDSSWKVSTSESWPPNFSIVFCSSSSGT